DDDETVGAEGPVDDETTPLVTVVETAANDDATQVVPVDDDETVGAEGPVDDETTPLVTVVETAANDDAT
ncbi:hypothetical protein CTI14_71720, partial [Methylobacterium radiotolerans]